MNHFYTFLRPAIPEDSPAIYQVHRHAVRYTCREVYDEQTMNAWLALIDHDIYSESMGTNDKTLWVAELEGKIQGFFQIDFKEAQIDALYVHPFVHRQGLGTAMLQRAESLAQEANLSILSLFASQNSVPFYELNGYVSLGDAIVPIDQQTKIQCQLMRKFL
ncbi:GNAT family N-acetyltransferase [Neisseriaceae bacterium B1]